MGAQGQLTQGAIMCNPRTKYKRSKNVFAVTSIALIVGRDWPRLVQPLAQSLIGSPGTLVGNLKRRTLKGVPEPSILDDFCLGNVISKYFSKLRFGTS